MIVRKHSTEDDDPYFEYPYYAAGVQRRHISTKRRWFKEKYSGCEEIVVIDNPNIEHEFNRFEEEGHVKRYRCHFSLIDLTCEDLYIMGVPALED